VLVSPIGGESVARWLAAAAVELAAQPDVQATLATACELAMTAVSADAAAVMLRRHGSLIVGAATPDVVHAEEMQLAIGEGPCLPGAADVDTFLVTDMGCEPRWPRWASHMVELGWGSCVSVRLPGRAGSSMGSLSVFSRRVGQFQHQDVELTQLLVQHASVAIAASRASETLRQAVDARHAIGMAQGILMRRYGLDVDAAFATLRRYSQDHNQKLAAVAHHVIAEHDVPPDEHHLLADQDYPPRSGVPTS